MAKITKALVNTNDQKLHISATSSYNEESPSYYYKFTELCIDSSKTFNCKNDESTHATTIQLDIDYNTDLDDFTVDFNDIVCSEDVANDLLFIWLKEAQYVESESGEAIEAKYKGLNHQGGFVCNETAPHYGKFFICRNNDYWVRFVMDGDGVLEGISNTIFSNEEGGINYEQLQQYLDGTYPRGSIINDYYVESLPMGNYIYAKLVNDGTTTYYRVTYNPSLPADSPSSYYIEEIDKWPTIKVTDIASSFGVTLAVKEFYELLLDHIDIVAKDNCDCNPDCSDVNFMLAWQGFNLSKTLQDYNQMIKYWKILHSYGIEVSSGCGCNK